MSRSLGTPRRHVTVSVEAKTAFLRRPRSYAQSLARVTAIETHFAWVFLAGRLAYKLKKPARHAGMDYRSLAARELGCREELRLNRRLAPGIYLAVVPLTLSEGRLRLDGRGRVVDYLVKMRRLPAAAMLDRKLARGKVRERALEPLVNLLADFYRRATPEPLAPRRYLARLDAQFRANRAALRPFRDRLDWQRVQWVTAAQREILRAAAETIGARGARLVDAHGDLRAEHVCLQPLAVIDSLEFDRDLRRLDPLEDLALLVFEIARGEPKLAREFLCRMSARLSNPVPACVTHLYVSHCAMIRAKLAAWHLGDPRYENATPWIAKAEDCLRRAELHARRALRLASKISPRKRAAARGLN